MFFDIDLVEDLDYPALLVDEECLAVGAHIFLAVHRFLDPYAVFLDHLLVRIGDQRIWQVEFGDELLVRLLVIDRDADDLNILLVKLVARIPERTRFERSARRVVLRIEPENDTFAGKIF